MSNPKIKLSYFDVEVRKYYQIYINKLIKYKKKYILQARGEPIRLALHIADVPFEDHRIKKWDDFQDMK